MKIDMKLAQTISISNLQAFYSMKNEDMKCWRNVLF